MTWNYNYGLGREMMWGDSFGGLFTTLLVPLVLWTLIWKGWALWRAAKNDSKPWFIALLLVNTMGILEILYLFVFGREAKKASKKK